jgi:hypothetical protein
MARSASGRISQQLRHSERACANSIDSSWKMFETARRNLWFLTMCLDRSPRREDRLGSNMRRREASWCEPGRSFAMTGAHCGGLGHVETKRSCHKTFSSTTDFPEISFAIVSLGHQLQTAGDKQRDTPGQHNLSVDGNPCSGGSCIYYRV